MKTKTVVIDGHKYLQAEGMNVIDHTGKSINDRNFFAPAVLGLLVLWALISTIIAIF